jgi:hypothetical protein
VEGPEEEHQEEKKDVSDLDREWILGFTAGEGIQLGSVAPESFKKAESEQAGADEAATGIWFPSRERVVWDWPRLDERLLEDPD